MLSTTLGERLGYPTRKPIAIDERMIFASSDEGDMVLDPFAGCATTLVAAEARLVTLPTLAQALSLKVFRHRRPGARAIPGRPHFPEARARGRPVSLAGPNAGVAICACDGGMPDDIGR